MKNNIQTLSLLLFWSTLLLVSDLFAEQPVFHSGDGGAQVEQSGNQTIITQFTDSTIIQWESFSIGQGSVVEFRQPSTTSIAINAILGQQPSQILGSLVANGRVVLLNPNGFYFGAHSSVSANTFIAATVTARQIAYNADQNLISIENGLPTNSIELQGVIQAKKIQLLAETVSIHQNSVTHSGQAYGKVLIRAYQDILLQGRVSAVEGEVDLFASASLIGSGEVQANVAELNAGYISLSGNYRADTISIRGGAVALNTESRLNAQTVSVSAVSSDIILSSTINATSVMLQAKNSLSLFGAQVFAHTIVLGTPQTYPAIIAIDTSSLLSVSATNTTSAGYLFIKGNLVEQYGTLLANAQYGNGGFIEISAHTQLKLGNGIVQAFSQFASAGTIVIDPDYILISDLPTSVDFFQTIISRFVSTFNPTRDLVNDSNFGSSVALSDLYLAIGASNFTNSNGDKTGNVYILNLNTSSWTDLYNTTNSPVSLLIDNTVVGLNPSFGSSISLYGDYLVIGAPGAITNNAGVKLVTGKAFIYKLDGGNGFTATCATTGLLISAWCDLSSIPASPVPSLAANSGFGSAVAVRNNNIAIGAIGVAPAGLATKKHGNVYLYNITSQVWTNIGTTYPTTVSRANAQFGWSVALNSDFLAVGAREYTLDSSCTGNSCILNGEVFLFRINGTNAFTSACETVGTLTSPYCALSTIDVDTATVGVQNPFTLVACKDNLYCYFGNALTINDSFIFLSANYAGEYAIGKIYAYRIDGTKYFQSSSTNCGTTGLIRAASPFCDFSLLPSSPFVRLADTSRDEINLGSSLASNNSFLVVGATNYYITPSTGDIKFYTGNVYTVALCVLNSTPCANPWTSLIDIDENITQAGIQNPFTAFPIGTEYQLGNAVTLNVNFIAAGAWKYLVNRGNVYLYALRDRSFTDIYNTNYNASDTFSSGSALGTSVATYIDTATPANSYVLLGAPGSVNDRGSAYLLKFKVNSHLDFWWEDLSAALLSNQQVSNNLRSCTTSSTPGSLCTGGSKFGTSVAINSTYAVIGAPGENAGQGGAYIFRLDHNNNVPNPGNTCPTPTSTTMQPWLWCNLSNYDTDTTGGNQVPQNPILLLAANANFGYSVSISSNDHIIIGAPKATTGATNTATGNAFLLSLNPATNYDSNCHTGAGPTFNTFWCDLSTTTTNPNPITTLTSGARFGESVVINSTYAVIGASNANSGIGNGYIYRINGNTNSFNASCGTSTPNSLWCTISNANGYSALALPTGSKLGSSVSITSDSRLVAIGAPGTSTMKGEVIIYKTDNANVFSSNCAISGTLNTPFCKLSTHSYYSSLPLVAGSSFGASVSIQTIPITVLSVTQNIDFVLIGAPKDSAGQGRAYLYNINSTNTTTHKLGCVSTTTSNSWCMFQLSSSQSQPFGSYANYAFGTSVSLNSYYSLVGAPGVSYNLGEAYIFYNDQVNRFTTECALPVGGATPSVSTCSLARFLTSSNLLSGASPSSSLSGASVFGVSLALTDTTVIIGAPGLFSGRGDAFILSIKDLTWLDLATTIRQPILALPVGSNFGASVAVANSNHLIGGKNSSVFLIGAPGKSNGRGSAYLYSQPEINSLTFSTNCQVNAASISSQWCNLEDATMSTVGVLAEGSLFGTSVALYSDATRLMAIVGAPGAITGISPTQIKTGDVYLYNVSGLDSFNATCGVAGPTTPWCKLSNSGDFASQAITQGSNFGFSVALNAQYALIGAPGASSLRGDAFLYRISGEPTFNATCGIATATSAWCKLSTATGFSTLSLASGHWFGYSVALNNNVLLVGSPNASVGGNAFLYRINGTNYFDSSCVTTAGTLTTPWCRLSSLAAYPAVAGDKFGWSVSINDSFVAVSSPYFHANEEGTAYLYEIATTTFNNVRSGGASNPANTLAINSYFGYDIALSNSYILVGAPGQNNANGNAFLYLIANYGTLASNTTIISTASLTSMLSANVSLIATKDISFASSFTYLGANTLTLTAPTINAYYLFPKSDIVTVTNLTINATGDIGTELHPLIFDGQLANLTAASSGGNLYLAHVSNVQYLISASQRSCSGVSCLSVASANELSLSQLHGGINLTSNILFANSIGTLTLRTLAQNSAINTNSFSITTSSSTALQLISATGIIGSGTFSASRVTLRAYYGDIGQSGTSLGYIISPALPISANSIVLYAPFGSVYLRSSNTVNVSSYLLGSLNTNFAFLEQTTGNVVFTSSFIKPTSQRPLTLQISALQSGSSINVGSFSISSDSILLSAPLNISGSGTLSTDANGRLQLVATNGSIGTSLASLILNTTSSNWTTSNLTLSAPAGSIYIKTPIPDILTVLTIPSSTIAFSPSATFDYEYTAGNISLPSSLIYPNATIKLTASATSATIDLSSFNITATTISLTADTNLTTTTGILTSGASGTISLTSTNGDIGSSTNPILITQNAITGDLSASAAAGNIYLSSTSSSLTLGAITSATAATNIILISASAT
ncbi:MAG: filamentous hemagglutinin N-terminal domain-containing protein, partial [Methylacidiphilales bacterium]|nr:filamentous hemagglutinin N-terminal domain-containing protein [Candidatus Methylacidiphilales bacterium]